MIKPNLITKPNLNKNTWKCKKIDGKSVIEDVVLAKKEVKRRWREDSWLLLSKSHFNFENRKNPPKSKIKYAVIRWLKIMLWDGKKRGGKKMERGWLAPFKSQFQSQFWPLFNLNIGKSPRNQRSRILFKSDDWKSCCEMAKKRWKEDGERALGSLQVPLSQR